MGKELLQGFNLPVLPFPCRLRNPQLKILDDHAMLIPINGIPDPIDLRGAFVAFLLGGVTSFSIVSIICLPSKFEVLLF
jgi:hypothetical protein